MGNIFFTSDIHGYHKNICRGTTEWKIQEEGSNHGIQSTRNFDTPEEMTEEIVKTFNKYVQWDDTLYFLGDWTFGGFNNIKRLRDQINCQTIHVILGNHDHHIENNKEGIRGIFSSVQHVKTLSIDGHRVFLSHYSHRVYDKSHKGAIHLYGHSHDSLDFDGRKPTPYGKTMDVGIDSAYRIFGEYKPFSWKEIQSIMAKRDSLIVDHHNSQTS